MVATANDIQHTDWTMTIRRNVMDTKFIQFLSQHIAAALAKISLAVI